MEKLSLLNITLLRMALVVYTSCLVTGAMAQGASNEIPSEWPSEWKKDAAQLDLTTVQTGLLLNYALFSDSQLRNFRQPYKTADGVGMTPVKATDWGYLYQQLRAADIRKTRMADYKTLNGGGEQRKGNAVVIPIGVLNMEGNLLTEQQTTDNKANKKKKKATDGSAYETVSVLAASVLQESVYQGAVSLQFDPARHVANSKVVVQEAGVDFMDGKGFRMVHMGAPEAIDYTFDSPGRKMILIKLKTNKGEHISISQLNIKTVVAYPEGPTFSLSAPRTYSDASTLQSGRQSAITGGTLRAVLGCDGILDKPVLIVEGFDPGNARGFNQLIANYLGSYNGSSYNGTFNTLTNSGYDLVFLNFDEARDYIQNNANVVKAAIRKLNEIKSGNGQLVVVGESAGGLTARYALKKLEQEGYAPNVSHYISYDSPHRGAHIPEGIQYLARDAVSRQVVQLVNKFSSSVQPLFSIVDDGDTPASRQLIMQRADLSGGIYTHPDFSALQNELAQLGYPSQSRNVAMVCGSLNGNGQLNTSGVGESQGQRILVLGGNVGYDAIATSPISNQFMEISFLRVVGANNSFSGNFTKNPDVVPGGFDRNAADIDPGRGFRYCFIPTYSAIDSPVAINSDGDMYQFNASSSSPFARIYGDQDNSEHVVPSQRQVAWSNLFRDEFGATGNTCPAPISYYPPIPQFTGPSQLCNGSISLQADDASGGIQGLPLEYNWKLERLANGMGTVVRTGSGQFFGLTASDYSSGYYRVTLSVNYTGHSETYSNFIVIGINVNCPGGGRQAAETTEAAADMAVFPNPSSGSMTITAPVLDGETVHFTLMNTQGASVEQTTGVGPGQHSLQVPNQPAGLYLLQGTSNNRRWTKKVLITP